MPSLSASLGCFASATSSGSGNPSSSVSHDCGSSRSARSVALSSPSPSSSARGSSSLPTPPAPAPAPAPASPAVAPTSVSPLVPPVPLTAGSLGAPPLALPPTPESSPPAFDVFGTVDALSPHATNHSTPSNQPQRPAIVMTPSYTSRATESSGSVRPRETLGAPCLPRRPPSDINASVPRLQPVTVAPVLP